MADDRPNPHRLYRLGGISALVLGACYLAITALYVTVGAPPTGGEAWLTHLQGRLPSWWGIAGLSVLTDLLFLPLAAALYVALKSVNRELVLIGAGLLALFAVLDLAVTWTNFAALFTLAVDYAAATTDAGRSALIAAANYPSAVLDSTLFAVYVILIPGLGILAISWAMRGTSFGYLAAYLGILTGALASVAVFGPLFVNALDLTVILTAVLTTIWVLLVGYRLVVLARG